MLYCNDNFIRHLYVLQTKKNFIGRVYKRLLSTQAARSVFQNHPYDNINKYLLDMRGDFLPLLKQRHAQKLRIKKKITSYFQFPLGNFLNKIIQKTSKMSNNDYLLYNLGESFNYVFSRSFKKPKLIFTDRQRKRAENQRLFKIKKYLWHKNRNLRKNSKNRNNYTAKRIFSNNNNNNNSNRSKLRFNKKIAREDNSYLNKTKFSLKKSKNKSRFKAKKKNKRKIKRTNRFSTFKFIFHNNNKKFLKKLILYTSQTLKFFTTKSFVNNSFLINNNNNLINTFYYFLNYFFLFKFNFNMMTKLLTNYIKLKSYLSRKRRRGFSRRKLSFLQNFFSFSSHQLRKAPYNIYIKKNLIYKTKKNILNKYLSQVLKTKHHFVTNKKVKSRRNSNIVLNFLFKVNKFKNRSRSNIFFFIYRSKFSLRKRPIKLIVKNALLKKKRNYNYSLIFKIKTKKKWFLKNSTFFFRRYYNQKLLSKDFLNYLSLRSFFRNIIFLNIGLQTIYLKPYFYQTQNIILNLKKLFAYLLIIFFKYNIIRFLQLYYIIFKIKFSIFYDSFSSNNKVLNSVLGVSSPISYKVIVEKSVFGLNNMYNSDKHHFSNINIQNSLKTLFIYYLNYKSHYHKLSFNTKHKIQKNDLILSYLISTNSSNVLIKKAKLIFNKSIRLFINSVNNKTNVYYSLLYNRTTTKILKTYDKVFNINYAKVSYNKDIPEISTYLDNLKQSFIKSSFIIQKQLPTKFLKLISNLSHYRQKVFSTVSFIIRKTFFNTINNPKINKKNNLVKIKEILNKTKLGIFKKYKIIKKKYSRLVYRNSYKFFQKDNISILKFYDRKVKQFSINIFKSNIKPKVNYRIHQKRLTIAYVLSKRKLKKKSNIFRIKNVKKTFKNYKNNVYQNKNKKTYQNKINMINTIFKSKNREDKSNIDLYRKSRKNLLNDFSYYFYRNVRKQRGKTSRITVNLKLYNSPVFKLKKKILRRKKRKYYFIKKKLLKLVERRKKRYLRRKQLDVKFKKLLRKKYFYLYLKSHKQNFFATILNKRGKLIAKTSGGLFGNKGPYRSTKYVATKNIERLLKKYINYKKRAKIRKLKKKNITGRKKKKKDYIFKLKVLSFKKRKKLMKRNLKGYKKHLLNVKFMGNIVVFLKNSILKSQIKAAVRSVLESRFNILRIYSFLKNPHNGCKVHKSRRL